MSLQGTKCRPSYERFHLKALPVREFCAKFCDGTVLFCSVTERAPGLPDHSSTLILPRGGSPLAVPHLCDPQYSITASCQNTDYYKDVFCIFSPLYASRTQQFKLPNVKQLYFKARLSNVHLKRISITNRLSGKDEMARTTHIVSSANTNSLSGISCHEDDGSSNRSTTH